jgi:hypothetical protein
VSQLAPLLLPFEQIARAYAEYVTQRIERSEVDSLGPSVGFHKTRRRGDRNRTTARLRQRVGGTHAALGHQVGESEPHIEHTTNVTTEVGMCNSGYPLAVMPESGYVSVSEQEPNE